LVFFSLKSKDQIQKGKKKKRGKKEKEDKGI